jgi:hypothetical protein
MWQEAVSNFTGGTEENHETSSQNNRFPGSYSNSWSPKYEARTGTHCTVGRTNISTIEEEQVELIVSRRSFYMFEEYLKLVSLLRAFS